MRNEEKREYARFMVDPIPLYVIGNNTKSTGLMMDISIKGVKIWTDDKLADPKMLIIIPVPDNISSVPLCFSIRKIWTEQVPNEVIIEIGCQFDNVSNDQERSLTKLIECLASDNCRDKDFFKITVLTKLNMRNESLGDILLNSK